MPSKNSYYPDPETDTPSEGAPGEDTARKQDETAEPETFLATKPPGAKVGDVVSARLVAEYDDECEWEWVKDKAPKETSDSPEMDGARARMTSRAMGPPAGGMM